MNWLAKISLCGALITVTTLAISFLMSSRPEGAHVQGTVSLDGEPLKDIDIFFVATEGDDIIRSVSGHTDANGHYALIHPLPTGDYRVILRGFVGGDAGAVLPALGADEIDSEQLSVALSARNRIGANRRLTKAQIARLPRPIPVEWSSLRFSRLEISIPENAEHVANIELETDQLVERTDRSRVANAR